MLPTPLERAPRALCDFAGRDELWLKREDVHELGAFKWRSTLPVVTELVDQGHRAVVTSSTGNHGAAVAWACRRLDVECDRVRASRGERAEARPPREPGSRRPRRGTRSRRGEGCGARVRERARAPLLRRRSRASSVRRLRRDRGRDRRAVPGHAGSRGHSDRQRRACRRGRSRSRAGERPARCASGSWRSRCRSWPRATTRARWSSFPRVSTIADGLAVRVAIPLAVERLRHFRRPDAAGLGARALGSSRRVPRRGCPRRAFCGGRTSGDSRSRRPRSRRPRGARHDRAQRRPRYRRSSARRVRPGADSLGGRVSNRRSMPRALPPAARDAAPVTATCRRERIRQGRQEHRERKDRQ